MDPNQPSPDGTCHFFRLPAELRNIVYEYTLKNPKGVLCREEPPNNSRIFRFYAVPVMEKRPSKKEREQDWYAAQLEKGLETAMEINQLRHVCRQLEEETKNIVVYRNDLVFACGPLDLLNFLEEVPMTLHSYLREMTVWEHRPLLVREFIADPCWRLIARICEEYYAFTIRMIWPSLMEKKSIHTCSCWIIRKIVALAVHARKDRTLISKMSDVGWWRNILLRTTALAHVDPKIVIQGDWKWSGSIRMFPSHEPFPEHRFRLCLGLHPLQEQELEKCIATMKRVFEDGI